MRLNLSSQIVLNKVPVEFYKPKTTRTSPNAFRNTFSDHPSSQARPGAFARIAPSGVMCGCVSRNSNTYTAQAVLLRYQGGRMVSLHRPCRFLYRFV